MATANNAQLLGSRPRITAAQFRALPPHAKLQYSAHLTNEVFLSHHPIPPAIAATIGLGHLTPTQVLEHMYPEARTQAPALPKRPLNSWMAYRTFYSRLFAKYQQKDASGLLTILWQQDPFKSKWAVIARAYSNIRDQIGKDAAPLDQFLAMICPKIGIIAVEDYLEKMQWTEDAAGNLHQVHAPDTRYFEKHLMHTDMTERDSIHYVASRGYISEQVAVALAGPRAAVPGAAPANQAPQQGLIATTPSSTPSQRTTAFLERTAANPAASASHFFGFDVEQLLAEQLPNEYQWTGSMSDLYNPDAGVIDFDHLARDRDTMFEVADIHDPMSFDPIAADFTVDGFVHPFAE